jgi:nitrite reductase/ring-hydroxylating ferredoxin subunit
LWHAAAEASTRSRAGVRHEECPLGRGTLTDQQLECYCHGAVFNIRTGEALVGPAVASLETYPVREQDGEIQVEM